MISSTFSPLKDIITNNVHWSIGATFFDIFHFTGMYDVLANKPVYSPYRQHEEEMKTQIHIIDLVESSHFGK
jgi:hypothetical protein